MAVKLPKMAWALLVAKAVTGGSPTQSRAGNEISPPPPAMVSTRPASRARTKRMSAMSKVTTVPVEKRATDTTTDSIELAVSSRKIGSRV